MNMTFDEYIAEAKRIFGDDQMAWRWVCPACGHEQSGQDYKDADAPLTAVGFSCVGRWSGAKREAFAGVTLGSGDGPCNYAGGGLFGLNPVTLTMSDGTDHRYFALVGQAQEGGES